MLTIGSTLAIFLMLGLSSFSLFLAKRLNLPHTVLLVLVGIGLGFLAYVPDFHFISEFKLTPELLFYLLLPALIFESAYHMSARKLVADSSIVLILSIGSFLLSTLIITIGLHFLLQLIGLTIPFGVTLLFGALISATDPVAVLALFKEFGVPKRLSLVFEGESLFNDATAVALFLITLEALNNGGLTIVSSLTGALSFASMLVLGVIFGLLVGGVFAYLVGTTKSSAVASITLTIILAHITFILAEVISETHFFGEFKLPVSPIIATTVASLVMGNYGRIRISSEAESFVSTVWELFAFMANSLIFILIGIVMIEVPLGDPVIVAAILITIFVVAIARALSIYPVVAVYNLFQELPRRLPASWQHLLAWGSLRGALAVTMVFMVPDDLTIEGWQLASSPKEFLLAITTGCIAATLFIKATTIRAFVSKFKLDSFSEVEEVEYQEAKALMHHKISEQLVRYESRGYINSAIAENLLTEHAAAFKRACDQVTNLSNECRKDLAFRVLRIYAIGIEKRQLKVLHAHDEVTESVFRRIEGKLKLQLEAIEDGNLSPDLTIHSDSRDVFEYFFSNISSLFKKSTLQHSFAERYMYYRAQTIISRKVLKELQNLERASTNIFTVGAVSHVNELYTSFKVNSDKKLRDLSDTDPASAIALANQLAKSSVKTIEESVLDDIFAKELITQKLYIALREEISNRQV